MSTAGARFPRSKGLAHRLLRRPVRWLLRLLWRVSWLGEQHVPHEGAVLLAPNHQSYLDPVLLGAGLRRPPSYLADPAYVDRPILGRLMRLFGAIPVGSRRGARGLRRAREVLDAGEPLAVFPEGERTRDGGLLPFRTGVARLARLSGAPVVPVAIVGAYEVWPRHRARPRLGRVEIRFGAPLFAVPSAERVGRCSEEDRLFLQRLRSAILDLARGRIGPDPGSTLDAESRIPKAAHPGGTLNR